MKTSVRAGIVTVAATVALGTAGFAVASAGTTDTKDPVVKREDTASSWTQSTNVDDDDDLRDDTTDDVPNDSPTNTGNTAHTVNTAPTTNTAPTKNTIKTVNSAPTKNSAPTADTASAS